MRITFSLIFLVLTMYSCSFFSSKKDKKSTEDMEYQLMKENTTKMKKILFVLPSPIETSLLIKNTGVAYRQELLNQSANLASYSTSSSRAIALGIYCADLSYAGLNDQYQTSLEYINITRNLAESLGILKAVDPEKIKLLENNLNNKKLVIDLISEIYMESQDQLREQERYKLASLMLIGGWVESLYLASQSMDKNEVRHQVLVDRILDQELSLMSIKSILSENQSDPIIEPIYKDIIELEITFNKTVISTNKELDFYDRVNMTSFELLKNKVADMREYLVH